jgi:hypothetical protein
MQTASVVRAAMLARLRIGGPTEVLSAMLRTRAPWITPNIRCLMNTPMRTRSWKKILLAVATLIGASIAFAGWYQIHFSMSAARPFEVNDPQSSPRVLIATQGSEFKDAVVAGVVEHLEARAAYVKVIDVSALPGVDVSEWNAIVLLHTWEMRKPPEDVKAFVDRTRNSGKLVVLTTSGSGDFKLDGVDAISSASIIADVPARTADIAARLDAILGPMMLVSRP